MRARLLLVGHEANRTGAPIIQLSLCRWLAADATFELAVTLLNPGELVPDFRAAVPQVSVLRYWELTGRTSRVERLARLLGQSWLAERVRYRRLAGARVDWRGSDVVLVNSAVAMGGLAQDPPTVPVIVHVHELQQVLQHWVTGAAAEAFQTIPSHWIAAGPEVARNLVENWGIPPGKLTVVPEFLGPVNGGTPPTEEIPIVLGCGLAQWRKGTDLFLQAALAHRALFDRPARWVWVGDVDDAHRAEISRSGGPEVMEAPGPVDDPTQWHRRSSVFALTSREDPMPLVALEAMRAGRPVVCFRGTGGIPALLNGGAGKVVPYADAVALARAVESYLADPPARKAAGARGSDLISRDHVVDVAGPRIRDVIQEVLQGSRT